MNTEYEDEKVEAYLRQFRPREPGSLPKLEGKGPRWLDPIVAAAAAAAIMAISVLLVGRRQPVAQQTATPQSSSVSLGKLSRMVREHPDSLDTELESLSPRLLPDVQRSRGILKDLARE